MTSTDTADATTPPAQRTIELLSGAVHQNRLLSKSGLNERAFTLAFSGLVYPQIWEDPEVDLEALALAPGMRMVTIASGGCNVMSYAATAPIEITAVDLNRAHIALNRLKIAAAQHLPGHSEFYRLFGHAACRSNVTAYGRYIEPHLDAETKAYWNGRNTFGRRRIERFARGFYRFGLLGRFITTGHMLARTLGADPRRMLDAKTLAEQREIYDRTLKPLFQKPIVRKILDQRASLFGLGIPPAQYDALAEGRPMHEVVEERLEKLACGSDLKTNYFAWQAFNRGYAAEGKGPLPLYLRADSYESLKRNAGAIDVRHENFIDHLAGRDASSTDRYVLLDAQDWMDDATLTNLWREITRTARPGARVIFRTAGKKTILPGRVPIGIMRHWDYQAAQSEALGARDRSAIYGAFHLYVKAD